MANGSAVAAWHRTIRGMARKTGAGRRYSGEKSRYDRGIAPRLRHLEVRDAIDAGGLRARGQCLYCAAPMAGRICHSQNRARAMGALAFDRGDASDRVSDGLGVVETLARGRTPDCRRRRDLKAAF